MTLAQQAVMECGDSFRVTHEIRAGTAGVDKGNYSTSATIPSELSLGDLRFEKKNL